MFHPIQLYLCKHSQSQLYNICIPMPWCQVFGSYVYPFGNLTPTLLWLWKWSSASSTWFTYDMNMVRRCERSALRVVEWDMQAGISCAIKWLSLLRFLLGVWRINRSIGPSLVLWRVSITVSKLAIDCSMCCCLFCNQQCSNQLTMV